MHYFLKDKKGQSLLEVTISLGLLVVVLFALAVVTINALRNSQLAKNQSQATKLAQESVDLVRTIRNKNCPLTMDGISYYWYTTGASPSPPLVWDSVLTNINTKKFRATLNADGSCGEITDINGEEKDINGTFTRVITITQVSPKLISLTANVSWEDISGDHNSQLVTILSNN
jgi:hypothetical protein